MEGCLTEAVGPLSRRHHHLKCHPGNRDRQALVEGEEAEGIEVEEGEVTAVVVAAAMEVDMVAEDTEEAVVGMGVAMEGVVMEGEEGTEVTEAVVMEEEEEEAMEVVVEDMAEAGEEEVECRGVDGTGDLHMPIIVREDVE